MYKIISVICILLLFTVSLLNNFSLITKNSSTILIVLLLIIYFLAIVFIKFDLFNKMISKYKSGKKQVSVMNKQNIERLVPSIIVLLTLIVSSLRTFSIISPAQTIYAIIMIIFLAIILSKVQKVWMKKHNQT